MCPHYSVLSEIVRQFGIVMVWRVVGGVDGVDNSTVYSVFTTQIVRRRMNKEKKKENVQQPSFIRTEDYT